MRKSNIEAIYPLTHLQKGLLFHTVCAPKSGMYLTQICWLVRGELNVTALKQAWQLVIDRHQVLRTAFIWENQKEPLQVVARSLSLNWNEQDWRSLSSIEQQERVKILLEEDFRAGFELSKPPLMRLFLIWVDEDAYYFIWNSHHLMLDGWSSALVLQEVLTTYDALSKRRPVDFMEPQRYQHYIVWLRQQDLTKATAFWRRALKGFTETTRLKDDLSPDSLPGQEGKHEKQRLTLAGEQTAALQSLVRQHQLTLNTLAQGIWALLLGHYSGKRDVIFGMVVSGRPPELQGVETMVGVFINSLPVRVQILPQSNLWDWLAAIQAQQIEMQQYEYSPLMRVSSLSELPRGESLFDTLWVFDNYPISSSVRNYGEKNRALEFQEVSNADHNSYPLTVTIGPGTELVLEINYDSSRFSEPLISQILANFASLFNGVIDNPDEKVGYFEGRLLEAEGRQRAVEEKKIEARGLSKFRKIKPVKISTEQQELVVTRSLLPGQPLPLVMEPAASDIDLPEWAMYNVARIEEGLSTHGAILFRGFRIEGASEFERFVLTICPQLFSDNGEHVRESISGNVYTPVAYPADSLLLWHNENTFNYRWPTKISFGCLKPARQGGETPIVDSRKVFEMIDPGIRKKFLENGVMYVRNYGVGLGLNWETVLGASTRSEAEEHCRRTLMEFTWKKGNRLETRCVRPAAVRHPKTGEMVWFNQAQHWHLSCLSPEVRTALLSLFEEDDLPRNCYYGDGSLIEDSVMREILEVYKSLEVSFPWKEGDILVLDNLLTAHGRKPFFGERSMFVAMGDMLCYDDVAHR